MRFAIFPKFLGHLSADQLGAALAAAGLDECKLLIRDGYWTPRATLARDTPLFIAAMRRHGLGVTFATAGFQPREIIAEPGLVATLVDNGIGSFRLGMATMPADGDIRRAMRAWRDDLARVADICAKLGARAVHQVHHDCVFSSPTSAWWLVDGLDPKHVGVELDAGNQALEGFEAWGKSCDLLGPYLAAVGVKDISRERDPAHAADPDKGWRWRWCAIDEGVTDWHALTRALVANRFDGHCCFMPFYHEHDATAQLATLARDVRYLRAAFAAASANSAVRRAPNEGR